jgi:hypothetical protein
VAAAVAELRRAMNDELLSIFPDRGQKTIRRRYEIDL